MNTIEFNELTIKLMREYRIVVDENIELTNKLEQIKNLIFELGYVPPELYYFCQELIKIIDIKL